WIEANDGVQTREVPARRVDAARPSVEQRVGAPAPNPASRARRERECVFKLHGTLQEIQVMRVPYALSPSRRMTGRGVFLLVRLTRCDGVNVTRICATKHAERVWRDPPLTEFEIDVNVPQSPARWP